MKPGRRTRRLLAIAGIAAVTAGGIATSGATFTAHRSQSSSFATAGDWTAPVITITGPGDGARTNDSTPTIFGTAGTAAGDLPAVTVKIHSGTATGPTVQTLNVTAGAGGAWNVTATTLPDGLYTAVAAQSDTIGNAGTSAPVSFTIDRSAPTVAITTPAAGGQTSGNGPITGTGSTGAGDASTVSVQIWTGTTTTGTAVRTLTATLSGSTWSVPITPALASGTYTVRATQADDVGNSGNSGARTFTIDAAAPTPVRITTPTNNQWLATGTPTLTGQAGNATGDSPTVTVNFYAGATVTGSPVATRTTTRTTGTWSLLVSPGLPDGQYTAQATQADQVGNSTSSAARTFRIDTVPPTVTITAPATGARTTARPVFSGAGGLVTGDSGTITLRFYAGSTATGTVIQTRTATRNATTGLWTTTANTLTAGTYTAQASQADSAGHTGTSAPITIVVDPTAPTAQAIAAINGTGGGQTAGHLDNGDRVTFTYSEAMAPATMLAGWAGAATPVTVRIFNNGTADRFSVLNAAASASLGITTGSTTAGGVTTAGDYVSGQVTFAATMTLSPDARTVTIVLGAPDVPASIRPAAVVARNMGWGVNTAARDVAGNAVTGGTVTETDNDRDF